MLEELIATCKICGTLSLPVIQWEEMDDEEEEALDKAAAQAEADGADELAVVTRNLPQLQRRAMKEVGFLFSAYHADWCVWLVVTARAEQAVTFY